jgi:hypothetical protein
VRLHSLPHRPAYPDRPTLDDVQEVALAA